MFSPWPWGVFHKKKDVLRQSVFLERGSAPIIFNLVVQNDVVIGDYSHLFKIISNKRRANLLEKKCDDYFNHQKSQVSFPLYDSAQFIFLYLSQMLTGSVHMSQATQLRTSVGQNLSAFVRLFSSHHTGTKLTNKHSAVCFDTGDYTLYYHCYHPSALINIKLTYTILQNTTSDTNKGLNRQNISIPVTWDDAPRWDLTLPGWVMFHMNTKEFFI